MTRRSGVLGNCPWWAWASFAAYLAWNATWLVSGRIPPSPLRALLGVPCPTTGGTRSLFALLRGDVLGSLLWNPFTVPMLILLAMSLAMLILDGLRKKELALPKWVATLWASVLIMAWLAKFLLGRAYW